MRRTGWRKYFHLIWVWSVLVTVPVTVLFAFWMSSAIDRYSSLGVRLDVQGGEAQLLHPILEYEWHRTKRKLGLQWAPGNQDHGLQEVELWMSKGDEVALNQNLPQSGREYVGAKITHPDGSIEKASVRYRGDMMHHWALAKKSWRVKTKKKHLWNGIRKFNLILPETWGILEEHFGNRLAGELGLLAPVSELVNLRINGENRGLHTLVGQVDELFLRSNQRMPGDLYVGDLLLSDAIPGFDNKVFDLPGAWTKSAINNHFPDEHAAPMFRLCEILDWEPGPRKAQALGQILDLEAFGRFAAYRSLVQTGHVDSYHNWKLYYDPWRNRFEPVVWDPNAWGGGWAPNAENPAFEWPLFAELDRVLVHDHRFRWAQHKAMHGYLHGSQAQSLLADMEAYGVQAVAAAESDPALAFSVLPSSAARAAEGIQALLTSVRSYNGVFRSRHVEAPAKVTRGEITALAQDDWMIPITVDGWRPVASIRLEFSNAVPKGARFYWSMAGQGGAEEVPARATVQGVQIQEHTRGHSFTHRSLPRPLTYRLRISKPGQESLGLTGIAQLDLAGMARPIVEQEVQEGAGQGPDFAVLFDGARPEPVVWSGEMELRGLTEIHGDLVIEAGTRLQMGEQATVLVHGCVQALGTNQAPIRIGPARKGQKPWGTFAIRTTLGDESTLQHVHMVGGSGFKEDLQEYSAMFSAHDVDGLSLLHCQFEDSQLVDDMVHVVYGQGLLIADCTFNGALSDALDLDGCQGRIERCSFDRSGNDAIDLMMSQIEVTGTTLNRSGDQ
ncbi:MAG: CotH kinase family protein, partial [Planctomycetota bacterium]|nr:CotH kinase family protein [Planctomycetota bacterium]